MSALLEQVLNLKKRADLKILNNPEDSKAFNASMKAANALLGAQGHHLFDQQELIRAFAGRSPEFYFRVIKKLAKKGIIVNDNAKQIIPAWGDQTKGTVHSKIHEQVRGLPKTDYSQLTEKQLVSQLTKQALARKRIAASTITATIQGLKKADPTFSALPAQYIARWIKENPKEFHKLTKDVPIPIPTEKRWPIGKGGPGTISIEGKRNEDLRRILGIGKGAGANAQYFDLGTGAAMAWGGKAFLESIGFFGDGYEAAAGAFEALDKNKSKLENSAGALKSASGLLGLASTKFPPLAAPSMIAKAGELHVRNRIKKDKNRYDTTSDRLANIPTNLKIRKTMPQDALRSLQIK